MKAALLLRDRLILSADSFVEMRIWRTPQPVRGSAHTYKYALVYVVRGEAVIRYDNEAGKGDHRHLGDSEQAYQFTTPEALLRDFWRDVDRENKK